MGHHELRCVNNSVYHPPVSFVKTPRVLLLYILHSDDIYRPRGFTMNPLAMSSSELEDLQRQSGLVGEDAAVFSFEEQSLKSWGAFLAVLGTVLTALYYLWLNPDTGYGESASLPLPILQRSTRQSSVFNRSSNSWTLCVSCSIVQSHAPTSFASLWGRSVKYGKIPR